MHKWQQWKAWGGVRREGQRRFCQHCGMLRTQIQARSNWEFPTMRYERGDFKQEGHYPVPPCVGVFRPLTIDGFTITRARPLQDGEVVIPLELQTA